MKGGGTSAKEAGKVGSLLGLPFEWITEISVLSQGKKTLKCHPEIQPIHSR